MGPGTAVALTALCLQSPWRARPARAPLDRGAAQRTSLRRPTGRAGTWGAPDGGSRRLSGLLQSVSWRTGREGGLAAVAAVLGPGQDVRCGGLGAPGRGRVTPRSEPRGGGLREPLRDVSESLCCSALGKARERSEDDVEDCASSPCVEGN